MKWTPVHTVAVIALLIVAGTLAWALTRSTEEDKAQQVTERFLDAAGTGDGASACAQIHSDTRLPGCATFIGNDYRLYPGQFRKVRAATVKKVTISGDTAYVSLDPAGEVELRKEGDTWKVVSDSFLIS